MKRDPRRSVAAVAVVAIGVSILPTAASSAAAKHPRPISTVNPYPPDCGTDIEEQGFGERMADTETEPPLAANPRNSRDLVVGWMQDLYRGYVTAWSKNSGATWTTVTVPGI